MKNCIDCNKELANYKAKRCPDCYHLYVKLFGLMKGKNNPMFGVKSPNFKDGCSLKKYYCKICNKIISYQSALYGEGRCKKCTNKINAHWINKDCKNLIVNHHIYLKENSDEVMQLTSSKHIRLHMNGYKYLVHLGLEKEYIKEFIKNHPDAIEEQNVLHHIDCNRRNNYTDNFLYVASKGIHTKLHHEAYEYLVNVNKIEEYLKWFFLMEKKNPVEAKCKGGTIL